MLVLERGGESVGPSPECRLVDAVTIVGTFLIGKSFFYFNYPGEGKLHLKIHWAC